MTITRNMPAEEYHAIRAISAGMIWTVDNECPLKAWMASPWNPQAAHKDAVHFDIGTALHLAVLEPDLFEERVVLHSHERYASNEAKNVRDNAYAAGKTPLKPSEAALVSAMHHSMKAKENVWALFDDGDSEVTLEWEWNGLPCKCRPDFLASDFSYVLDLKSAASVNPRIVRNKLETEGWFVRAPWYLGGVKAVTGRLPDVYKFVVVEKDAPHICEIFDIDIRALRQGEQIIYKSLKTIDECLHADWWPSYSNGGTITLNRPTWGEFQHAEREEAGDFR